MDTSVLGIYSDQLAALATHLRGHRLSVGTVMGGLVVRDGQAEVVVTCRPRTTDRSQLWFFVEVDEPLVEAVEARMMDAVVAIKGRLASA